MPPKTAHKADILLEYNGATVGFVAAVDPETGNKRIFPGLAPKLAPQIRQDSVSYSYLPPDIDIVVAFEDWEGGAGYYEAAPIDVAPLVYNYSRGIDLSSAKRCYLAPERQAANASTGGAIAAAPIKFWDGSLGVYMLAGQYIYQWTVSSQDWVVRNDATGDGVNFTDIAEMDGVMYAGRGNTVDYKYSTDGTTWTAFTDSDNNFSFFEVRGIASAEAVLWGLKSTGSLKNSTDGKNGGVAWSSGDAVAHTSETMQALVEANDDLYVFTTAGIYRYTGTAQESVWTGGRQMYRATNGDGAFLWQDGGIYVPYGDRLLRYDPLGDTSSTPSLEFVFPTQAMHGNLELNGTISAITGDADWLYVALKNAAGNTYILRGKPSQSIWHTFLYLGANDCDAMQVIGSARFNATNPALVFGYGTDCKYVILPRAGLRPEDDTNCRFDTGSGTVYGPWVSIGARQFPKILTSGRVIAENCTAGMPITLSYEIDASGTEVSAVAAVSAGLTATNVSSEVEFLRIRYILTMSSGANTVSPRLLGALFHTNLLVPRKKMWTIDLELSPMVEASGNHWTAKEQETFLFGAVGQRVTFHHGHTHTHSVILQTIDSPYGVKETPAGDIYTYTAVFTEISQSVEEDNEMIWDEDLWDSGKVWGS